MWQTNVEQVPLGIRQRCPDRAVLIIFAHFGRAERNRSFDGAIQVSTGEVEMQPVLALPWLWNRQKHQRRELPILRRRNHREELVGSGQQRTFHQRRPELGELIRDAAVDHDLAEAERSAHQRFLSWAVGPQLEKTTTHRWASPSPSQLGVGTLGNGHATWAAANHDRSLRRGMIVLCLPSIGLPRCDVSSVWPMQCWWVWGRCWARVFSLLGDRQPQPQALAY